MNGTWALFFVISTCIGMGLAGYLAARLYRVRQQLAAIQDVLGDINRGNLNRRVLTRRNDMTQAICYQLNEMAISNQAQLMTSLSHDVKTPLTSLVGYLEAIREKMVTGEEKEAYIGVALDKAHHLKDFVESLFEWARLDAKEQVFQFERCDVFELTRDLISDWIPTLDQRCFAYDIDIPERECPVRLDRNAYTRILNNLLQNTLVHSGGNTLRLQLVETSTQVTLYVTDNGKGVPPRDLPHLFERLYQSDESRGGPGNGLGLAIVQELVAVHGGSVRAEKPSSGDGISFAITLPKAL
jgi:signal transduction histidine kinase